MNRLLTTNTKSPMTTNIPIKLFAFVAAVTTVALGTTAGKAQSEVGPWVQRYNGTAESDDRARRVVSDPSGNVIVVGSSHAASKGSDWLIIKYSKVGTPLWTNYYHGPDEGDDRATAVAVDSSGAVVVTGGSSSMSGWAGYNTATIKYSSLGIPLWTNLHTGTGTRFVWSNLSVRPPADHANAVAVDSSDNVFVTGGSTTLAYSKDGMPLWTNSFPVAASDLALDHQGDVIVTGNAADYSDYVTVKYSSYSGAPIWTNRYILCGYGWGYTAAVDGADTVFVAGNTDCNGSALVAYSGSGLPLWTNHFTGQWYQEDPPTAASVGVDGHGNIIVTGSIGTTGGSDFITVAYSNAGMPLWTNRYHGPGVGKDMAVGLSVDQHGDVLVVGPSRGGSGYYEYATLKYSGAGAPIWTNRYAGTGDSWASAVTVDENGDVLVTGHSWGGRSYDAVTIAYSSAGVPLRTNRFNRLSATDDRAQALALTSNGMVVVAGTSRGGGASDQLILAYSESGVPLWTNYYGAAEFSDDSATAITMDSSNNVFVAGTSRPLSQSASRSDFVTIKFSSAGVPLWTNRQSGLKYDYAPPAALAVDASGNLFLTGVTGVGTGNPAFTVIKYTGDGVPKWTNRANGGSPAALAVDHNGNAIVTGDSYSDNPDYATVKYSSDGVTLWTNRYNGPAKTSDFATAIAVDRSDNVFVTGYSVGIGTFYDWATIKYSSGGTPVWTNRYHGGHADDVPRGMVVDKGDNVIIAGSSWNGRSSDFVTLCYSNSGVPLWTNRYDGPRQGNDWVTAITINPKGEVLVAGFIEAPVGTGGSDGYATIAYSNAGIPLWTNHYSATVMASNPEGPSYMAFDRTGNLFVTRAGWNGSNHECLTMKYPRSVSPSLSITRSLGGTVILSWPSLPSGFVLQQNLQGISSSAWSNVLTAPSENGSARNVTLSSPAERAFYRLIYSLDDRELLPLR